MFNVALLSPHPEARIFPINPWTDIICHWTHFHPFEARICNWGDGVGPPGVLKFLLFTLKLPKTALGPPPPPTPPNTDLSRMSPLGFFLDPRMSTNKYININVRIISLLNHEYYRGDIIWRKLLLHLKDVLNIMKNAWRHLKEKWIQSQTKVDVFYSCSVVSFNWIHYTQHHWGLVDLYLYSIKV